MAKVIERTWKISDIDGGNRRLTTLTQYRAEIDASKAAAIATFFANSTKSRGDRRPMTNSAASAEEASE